MRIPDPRARYPGYTPTPPGNVPRDDPNRYDHLPRTPPAGTFAPGWDSRVFPMWEDPSTPWVLFTFSLFAFFSTQVIRLFGVYFLGPFITPLWLFVAALGALSVYASSRSAGEAILFAFMVLTVFFGVVLGSVAPAGLPQRLAVGAGATLVLGVFVDQLGAHALEWRMRRLGVPADFRERWMAWWAHRFDERALGYEISQRSTSQDSLPQLETELIFEIAHYPKRLLLLPLLVSLLLLPDAFLALATLPFAAVALACHSAPAPPVRGVLFVTAQAFQTFLRYAPAGDHVLGQWRSPAGFQASRRLMVAGVLCTVATAFLPLRSYVNLVGSALVLNHDALWALTPILFFESLIPLFIVTSAVTACLGRLLWSLEKLCPRAETGWTP